MTENAALVEAGFSGPDDERLLAELRPEYAVPCLDRDDCRTMFNTRPAAEEKAATEGGVIEIRLVTPWHPQ